MNNCNNIQRGDVLLNHKEHVAMFIGNKQELEVSINKKASARNG